MTALTKDYHRQLKEGKISAYPLAADAIIFKGALVMIVLGTGYLVPAADTASGVIQGHAYESMDNTGGSAGDKKVRVFKFGIIELIVTGVTEADIGKLVYATDDNTGVLTGAVNSVVIGKVDGIKGTNVAYVDTAQRWLT